MGWGAVLAALALSFHVKTSSMLCHARCRAVNLQMTARQCVEGMETMSPFNSKKGNPGKVVISKKVEQITVADVRQALTIPALDKDNTLLTAAQIGLKPGSTDAIGMLNAAALKNIPADCPGIKLDQMYYVYLPKGGASFRYKERCIVLDHDFVVDGEVGGKAVGGFRTNQQLFYTEHSLNLRKVRIVVEDSSEYFTFCVNPVHGIDQLQVTGCVFEGLKEKCGRTFLLDFKDVNPLDAKGCATDGNCIRHVLFDGNTHRGGRMVSSAGMRVVESCRFIGNTLYDVTGVGISLSTDNSRKYAAKMGYMSCPVYIVGNTFTGVERVLKKRTKWSYYYCAALVEAGQLYMLRNNIRNFVSGKTLYTTRKGERLDGYPATYDLYANVCRLYYCNNHVTNVLRFTKERTNYGIFKAKGAGVPAEFSKAHMPIVRYYSNNVFDIDREAALKLWKERTYPGSGGDYSAEMAYDKALSPDGCFTYNIQSYTSTLPVDMLTFRGNVIRAMNIGGMLSSSQWLCTAFICENNVFDSRNITSEEYYSRQGDMRTNEEWLFAVRGAGDNPSVTITGNRFTATGKAIRLLLYKYNGGQSPRARRTVVKNNSVGHSSHLLLKSLNSSKWTYGNYQVK